LIKPNVQKPLVPLPRLWLYRVIQGIFCFGAAHLHPNLQIILGEICNRLGRSMQALDPSELAHLDAWLGQIVSEERRAPGKR